MRSKTYFEKLKDPRWQKKRLEALSLAEFMCHRCYSEEETLHVHHRQYFKGREPWEYDVHQLEVLCESCHKAEHDEEDILQLAASFIESNGRNDRWMVASLIAGYVGSKPINDAICATEGFSPWNYEIGVTAFNILDMGASNIADVLAIARCSEKYPEEMFQVLLAFANGKEG